MIDLHKIASDLRGRIQGRIIEVLTEAKALGFDEVSVAINDAAIRRGCDTYLCEIDANDRGSDLSIMFALAYAFGDVGSLRRVKLALTDPRSKAREIDVLDGLIGGLSMEDAIRRAASAPPADAPASKIVPFPKKE